MRRLSPIGAEHVMREVLIPRAPVFELAEGIRRLSMPILVMCGDQDAPAFEPSRFIRDNRSPRRARRGADVRPHPELGRAGAVQPDRGLVPRRGRRGTMGYVARMTPGLIPGLIPGPA